MNELPFCLVLTGVLCVLLAIVGHDVPGFFWTISGVPFIPLGENDGHL